MTKLLNTYIYNTTNTIICILQVHYVQKLFENLFSVSSYGDDNPWILQNSWVKSAAEVQVEGRNCFCAPVVFRSSEGEGK